MISVLMSICNERKEWIEEAVTSILFQTYSSFEFIIVVDNPSLSDNIRNYIENIRKQDSRIVVLYNETNLGLALSLNKGISIARGDYIARMDADDVSEPTRLYEEIAYLESNHFVDMVATNKININEEGEIISVSEFTNSDPNLLLPYGSMIVHPSIMIRKDTLRELGGYRNFPRSQDYDLWLRMLTANKRISIIDKRLLRYRVRNNSLSNTNRLQQFYINAYQKKLYRQRLRTGTDTFSEENLKKYLFSKRITDHKNKRCINALEILDDATEKIWKRTLRAFFVFPSLTVRIVINNLKKRYALFTNRRKSLK